MVSCRSRHVTVGPARRLLCLAVVVVVVLAATNAASAEGVGPVTYDSRSLMLNGKRELFISGAIHYPRSQPQMWPDLIRKAKKGGLNTIETYVFWNGHEQVKGQYNFQGRFDLVRFIKEVQKQDMYLILRIGPFIQGEWAHGGFPFWLRDEPGVIYRTDNTPFKMHMEKFVRYIIEMMKSEKFFYPQGGPIILAQIENEYNQIQASYKEAGLRYIKWAGDLALSFDVGVPWIMCKQKEAPGPIINACNGRHCGDKDTFEGPNHPTKPFLWAENWTAQFREFGDPPSQRSAEDLAFAVARFFAKNGTLVNYYMYHGGTNFGRTGAAFKATRYYDEAPLDEFGLPKDPKWGHLKDLHHALRLAKKALLKGDYSFQNLGLDLEAMVFEDQSAGLCCAFLSNINSKNDATVNFRGTNYFLLRASISILPDCKTVVYNSKNVNSQHSSRTYHEVKEAQQYKWEMYQEHIPTFKETSIISQLPKELFNMTKDETDYLWYTTMFNVEDDDLPMRRDIHPVVQIVNEGHAMIGFANGEYIGEGHGNKAEPRFVFRKTMSLKEGTNHITFLNSFVGFPDNGAYLEHKYAGVHTVSVLGLNTGTFDLTSNKWGHQVGLVGEKKQIYNESGASQVQWSPAQKNIPVTWYKRYFDAPDGDTPVVVELSSMSKGMLYVNGENLGRYWVSFKNPFGSATQKVYHIPREFLKPSKNLLVLFDESGGDPEGVVIMKVRRDHICSFISEAHPGQVRNWQRENNEIRKITDDRPQATIICPERKIIKEIVFADFGNPIGMCGNYTKGTCTAPQTQAIVTKACLGKASCTLDVDSKIYGADPNCPGTTITLAVHVKCSLKIATLETREDNLGEVG